VISGTQLVALCPAAPLLARFYPPPPKNTRSHSPSPIFVWLPSLYNNPHSGEKGSASTIPAHVHPHTPHGTHCIRPRYNRRNCMTACLPRNVQPPASFGHGPLQYYLQQQQPQQPFSGGRWVKPLRGLCAVLLSPAAGVRPDGACQAIVGRIQEQFG
jgi:hypothetical protein